MQRFLPLFIILFLPILSGAQEIPTTQKPLVTKITATWCPNCGSWGWTFFHDIIDDNPNNAIFLAAHPSGDLVSPEGQDFNSNLGASGQPKFYMNEQLIGVNSGNTAALRTQVSDDILAMNGQSPVVGTGIEVTRDGNTLTATTNTKFFSAADGDYHLAIYVIEDHVIANQANNSASADHPFILRTSFGGSTFGNSIASGAIAEGFEVQRTLTTTLLSTWNVDNLKFAAVVWKNVDGTFEYVNGNQVTESIINSNEEADFSAFKMSWMSQDASPQLTMTADKNYQALQLQVYTLDGRLVHSKAIDYLPQGNHIMDLGIGLAPSGSYAVKLSGKNLQKNLLLVK